MLLGLMLAQMSSTNCYPVGTTVQCNTYQSPGVQAAPAVDWNAYFRQNQQNQNEISDNFARIMQARRAQQAQQQEQAAEAEQAAQNRRAAAYDQVGSLIAQGKCTEARQLAQFYNKPDIIADTNRVCPEPPPPQQASAAAPPKVDADAPKITAMVAQGKCHEAETYAGVIRRPDLVAVAKLCKNP